jgi:chromosome segregation ATPase
MSEVPRDKAAALAEGMEAAGALIENLEQEVADLRIDLDEAAAALKAAQEEVSSRAGALQEKEQARVEAESKVEDLRAEISALKQQHSDEQLRLSNEHISEIAEVRRKLEEQRRTDVEAASSGTRVDTIKEEFRRERDALEARYRRNTRPNSSRSAARLRKGRVPWSAPSVKTSKGGWPRSGALPTIVRRRPCRP